MLLQIPGGPELLIIFLVMALLVGVPVVIAALFLFVKFVGSGDGDDEVAELKGRIEELEAQVAAGSEAAHNDVTVPDDRAASEARGEDGSASSADGDDDR